MWIAKSSAGAKGKIFYGHWFRWFESQMVSHCPYDVFLSSFLYQSKGVHALSAIFEKFCFGDKGDISL